MNGESVKFSDMLLPALVGGGIAGLLSGIPMVGCLCCLWLLGGGAIAVYMLRGKTFGMKEALLVGIVAGFFAAVTGSVVEALVGLISGQSTAAAMTQVIDAMRQSGAPPESIAQIEQFAQMMSGGLGGAIMVCAFFVRFVIFAIFTSIGALAGKSLMKPKLTGQA